MASEFPKLEGNPPLMASEFPKLEGNPPLLASEFPKLEGKPPWVASEFPKLRQSAINGDRVPETLNAPHSQNRLKKQGEGDQVGVLTH